MEQTRGIESVRTQLFPASTAFEALSVLVVPGQHQLHDSSSSVVRTDEACWDSLRSANPRLHDGPILSVSEFDSPRRVLTCRVDAYKRLAIQEAKRCVAESTGDRFNSAGIWLLGVKGWVIANDRAGHEHVLIARRGPQTRIYGMMWESAPAGGVPPPRLMPEAPSVEITTAMLLRSLASECQEELGLDLDWTGALAIAITQDSMARSYDIHLRMDLRTTINPNHAPACSTTERSWEYVDTAWLSRQDAPQFDRASGDAITPPTRAMLRAMGWVRK